MAWCQKKSKNVQQLEQRLNHLGYSIGQKYLELISFRENSYLLLGSSKSQSSSRREIRIIEILQFVHTTLWKNLFGQAANNLEKSQDNINDYMITDDTPLMSQFISVPQDMGDLNCSAFVAGIIEGVLDSAYFQAKVSAHTVAKPNYPLRTVYLITFDEAVIKREAIRFGK